MEKASLHCSVTANNGDPLPGVILTLTYESDKDKDSVPPATEVTNAKGKSTFLNLLPGEYELTAVMNGFQTVRQIVFVQVGQNSEQRIVMNPEHGIE